MVPRIEGYSEYTSIKDMKASLIGKNSHHQVRQEFIHAGRFVSLRGTVVRIASVKPLVSQMAFSCNVCSDTRVMTFEDGKFTLPVKCRTSGCKSKTFQAEKEHPDTITIDYQKIKLQEKLVDEMSDAGRVPSK